MPEQITCPECGSPVPVGAPHGLCPKCLLEGKTLDDPKPDYADSRGDQVEQRTVSFLLPVSEKPGDRIGPYKLLQKLGEGGCGIVYMAEQEEPVKRRVALKVIKLGMDTKDVIARFEAERQALALMDHPNIAKVLDGGATANGRPFFVMELVRGIPITKYCDENRLNTTQRLELFILVCQAIQHAHQKGIIHRDIKPSNILVADHDGTPVPKVIDFGIAKATAGQTLTDKTLFTAFEQFIGTPAYMSPEQAKLSGLDIDTRSDIYSLGVLLYELLTGKTPFEPKRLIQAGIEEICRIIREEEPLRPSTRLSTLEGVEQTAVARQRQSDPPKLTGLIRGDLDWIVMKALEKDRNRRYETATGLASDLQRYLNEEPVVARPPSNLYRFHKLVRRNKLAFGAGAAVAGALILGLGLSTWLFLRERAARQQSLASEKKSKLEASKSQQVAQFLKDMLGGVGPSVAKGRDTTMLREILDKTAARVSKDLINQPEVEMELRSTLAGTYSDLALYQRAEEIARGSLDLGRMQLGPEHPAVATALANLGDILWRGGKLPEAVSYTREALALQRKVLGNENTNVATSLNTLGNALYRLGKLSEAEAVSREALVMRRKLLGNEHTDVATSLGNLGNVLQNRGKLAEAESMLREALLMEKKLRGNEHPDVALALGDLGTVLFEQGRFVEAEALQREALAIERKIEGPQHRDVAIALCCLGNSLYGQGKLAEAESALRECMTIQRTVFGQEHPDLAKSLNNLASVLYDEGKVAEAETMYREAVAMERKLLGNEHPDLAKSLNNLASVLDNQGKLPEAETMYREALAMQRKLLGNDHVAGFVNDLVSVLQRQKKYDDAEILLSELLSRDTALKTQSAELFVWRGSLFGRRGRWPKAVADLTNAIALDPSIQMSYHLLAPALLENGDVASYHYYCALGLVQFGQTTDPVIAERMAKACLILPGSDLETISRLANLAVRADTNHLAWHYFEFAKGLAEYRQGRFEGAVDWMCRVLTGAGDDLNRDVQAYMVLAMASAQLGHPEEARTALAKGVEVADRLSKADSGDLGGGWNDWVIAHLLMREANSLVGLPTKSATKTN